MAESSATNLYAIAQIIYDKKGMNLLALDVQGLSSITDYILIAEGNVDRHVSAIAKSIIEELGQKGESPLRTEGLRTGDWVVLDYGEIMVHLFMPGLRDKYALEKMWQESKLMELPLALNGGEF